MMLEDVRDLLVTKGVTDRISGDSMPNTPDTVIALYDTTAFEPERTMGRVALEKRNLQTLIRAVDPATAETLANAVFTYLDLFVGVLSGLRYTILGRTTPMSIGQDENQRAQYTCNFYVWKERA